jgi:predicted dehydrogenase
LQANVLDIVVVGLGHQSLDDHLPAIDESPMFRLVGVVDIDESTARRIGGERHVSFATSVSDLLNILDRMPDAALIAVPHADYLPIIRELAERRIHIIKEKPFAVSLEDAKQMVDLVKKNNITLQVTLQRRFNPIYRSYPQLLRRIGKVYSIEGRYTLNIARLDEGWRASRLYAGGGALIDLGYHYIDLIVWYFGLPDSVTCRLSTGNREGQKYDVEDTAMLSFTYEDKGGNGNQVLGSLIVSRVYPDKDESLIAYGSRGSVAIKRGQVVRRDTEGNVIECLERTGAWPSALIDQIEEFGKNILSAEHDGKIEQRYLEQVCLVEAAYASANEHAAKNPNDFLNELNRYKEA